MCQSCVDIDKLVERQRELLRSITDQAEIERIKRLPSLVTPKSGRVRPPQRGPSPRSYRHREVSPIIKLLAMRR
jgi:hypothetical protein